MRTAILVFAACTTAAISATAAQERTEQSERGVIIVVGQVIDAASGDPITGASVELVGTGVHAITGAKGQFVLQEVLTGDHSIRISHIGYGTRTQRITVPRTQRVNVQVRLDPKPISVEGIEVTVRSEEERRVRSSAGRYSVVLEPKIDRAASMGRRVPDLLRQELGLRVREGVFVTPESMNERPEHIVCVESGRGSTRIQDPIRSGRLWDASGANMIETKTFCEMVQVFVDDVRLANPGHYLTSINLNTIARIEYMSPNVAGVKYGLAAADNGVLLLYMKKR